MTIDEYNKYRNTEQYEIDMKALKIIIYAHIAIGSASENGIDPNSLFSQIKTFNQFICAEAFRQIKQELVD